MIVKIFQLTDSDWVAAETLESAWGVLEALIGKPETDESKEFDPGKELTPKEMATLTFVDGEQGDENAPRSTFECALKRMLDEGEKAPFYFATNEC